MGFQLEEPIPSFLNADRRLNRLQNAVPGLNESMTWDLSTLRHRLWHAPCKSKSMVVGMLRIPLAPNRHAEVLEVLRSVQGPVLAQPGCRAYHIYEEQSPEPAVVLVERWESMATLEAHIRSESYRRILGAIELAGGPPEVSFEVVTASEGMDLVKRLRNVGGGAKVV